MARGKSLFGVPWRIKASSEGRTEAGRRPVEFSFEIEPPAYYDVGYAEGLELPIPGSFFSGNRGSDLDPHPESDLSGIAGSRVATLTVEMSNGEELRVHPRRAPGRVLARSPWLAAVRFYDLFFPAALTPGLITARDAGGHVLSRRKY